ncbi:MAG: ribonuclease HII [Desulfovibrionaceae bacterium]|nr:ribonuclease HII [Desulfovibrionaceae bacterium]
MSGQQPPVLPGLARSCRNMAGVDEAGRGCLAGPVVAAAVILPEDCAIAGLDDSKVLSAARRLCLAREVKAVALAWCLGLSWPREIDELNILQATFRAMARAVTRLRLSPEWICVDGDKTIPPEVLGQSTAQRAVVRGDSLVPAVSAASILAKTWRDLLMAKLDRRYPGYGLAGHKGYGTAEHLGALARLGPSPMHRMTFRGVLKGPEAGDHGGQACLPGL